MRIVRAMPVLPTSSYRSPRWLRNAHVQTVWPTLCRRVEKVGFIRERLDTPDGDFLNLDWLRGSGHGSRLAILSHGLEGNSRRQYMAGMARALYAQGFDVLAWNYRGCGGELNDRPRFYHSGDTGDLRTILAQVTAGYESLSLVGFSVGGNVTLRYLGEAPERVDPRVSAAAVFSVPCDLGACAVQLARPMNAFYLGHFLRSLKGKVRAKAVRFPDAFDVSALDAMRDFVEFDGGVTAPMFGFSSAEDYYARASSRPVLGAIRVRTLLVNARDDPFLTAACFPVDEAARSEALHLEIPAHGGHVGFVGGADAATPDGYWSEQRAVEWFAGTTGGK